MSSKKKLILIISSVLLLLMIGIGLRKMISSEGQTTNAVQVQKEDTVQETTDNTQTDNGAGAAVEQTQAVQSTTDPDAGEQTSESGETQDEGEIIIEQDTIILPGDTLEQEEKNEKSDSSQKKENKQPDSSQPEKDQQPGPSQPEKDQQSEQGTDSEDHSNEEGIELPIILFE